MLIHLKSPAWQKATGYQSSTGMLEEAQTHTAGSRQQGLDLGCRCTCPPLAQRTGFQGAEQGGWASGRGWQEEGGLCQVGKAHTCSKHALHLADDTPFTVPPQSTWPHLLPTEPPGSVGLCTSSLPICPETQSAQLAGSHFHQQIAYCMVMFETVKHVFLPVYPPPLSSRWLVCSHMDLRRGLGPGREQKLPPHTSFPPLCFQKPMLLRSSHWRPR